MFDRSQEPSAQGHIPARVHPGNSSVLLRPVAFKAMADGNVEVEHPRHVMQQEKDVIEAFPPAKRVVWLTAFFCVGT